jgi:hypothetical protein
VVAPVTDTSALPSFCPQLLLVEFATTENAAGSETTVESIAVHPLASVTVTV